MITPQPRSPCEFLVIGGGVAGCAAAIALAREGRSVTLVERDREPRHKVCGEFLSGEALDDLRALGINPASLGAVPIRRVRVASRGRAAEAVLPFPAASLTRRTLDAALLHQAEKSGVNVQRGRAVQTLETQPDGAWRAAFDDNSALTAPAVILATGKHDLRGHTRLQRSQRWVALKMYLRLAGPQGDATEILLYPGGYCGLQPVEDGVTNLCCIVEQDSFANTGIKWQHFLAEIQTQCPHLAQMLAGAQPLLDKPLAITPIPYGYLRRTTEPGLYCIGDQAAVIPSFTGDGISIALYTARRAAAACIAAQPAPLFQPQLRASLLGQVRLAKLAAGALNSSLGRAVLPSCLRAWPGMMTLTARLTRVSAAAHPLIV